LHTTTAIRAQIRRDTGGDSRMSGVGKRGAKVGAGFKLLSDTRNPTAIIRATGPMHLLERPTAPHAITPRGLARKKRGTGFRKGARALTIGADLRAGAWHPGTRGKRTFERGWRSVASDTPRIFQREVREAIGKAWR